MLASRFPLTRLYALLFNRRLRRSFSKLLILHILPFTFTSSVVLYILLAYVLRQSPRLVPNTLQNAKNLLVITASPGDEAIWFAPSILGVLEKGGMTGDIVGGLLVLGNGSENTTDEGEMRAVEMEASCDILGIDLDRCVISPSNKFLDDGNVWDQEDIIASVNEHVKEWGIDLIITFDDYGTSENINHKAISSAIREYIFSTSSPPATYFLTSTSLLRKYILLGDLLLTSLSFTSRILKSIASYRNDHFSDYSDKAIVVSPVGSHIRTRRAIQGYRSRGGWDRYLGVMMRRNVWINDLRRVKKDQVSSFY